jgi:hypothetical protein
VVDWTSSDVPTMWQFLPGLSDHEIPLNPLRSIEMLKRDGISPSFGAGADPFQSLRTKSTETTGVARVRRHEIQ